MKTLGGNRGGSWRKYFRDMEMDTVGISLASLRTVFTNLMRKEPIFLENLADKVFRTVYTENMYAEFRNYNKEDFTKKEKKRWQNLSLKLKDDTKTRNSKEKLKVLRYARRELTTLQETKASKTMAGGLALLRLIVELEVVLPKQDTAVNIFRIRKIKRSAGKQGQILEFTPTVSSFIQQAELQASAILFNQYPMVVTPTQWSGMLGGGYVTPRGCGSMTLIKSHNLKLYKDDDVGPDVYEALNYIQETPWRINKRVYAVMLYCMNHDLEIGELPVLTKDSVNFEKYDREEWEAMTYEERDTIIKERRSVYKDIESGKSKVYAFSLKMSMARRFLKYERFYYPHSFDFRGRIYPISAPVNPQADKYGQALLEFADDEALGETGKRWLAIHGANCYGLDSDSYSNRVLFVEQEEAAICAAATNPLGTANFWGEADDPYGFLAFCIEWNDMLKLDDHTKFKSRLPVKLDATSSGLQHYAAIFRDERGAVATNIVDGTRKDIYKAVAAESITILSDHVGAEEDLEAKQWKRSLLPNINRDACKPLTMCLPYGISLFGATDALVALQDKGKLSNVYLTQDTPGMKKFRFLSSTIMQGVGTVVNSAIVGMDWLKDIDKAISKTKTSKEIRYKTKLGFPFIQQYYKADRTQIEAFFGDVRIRLWSRNRTKSLDYRKSNTAIAPNFIHSQDATHLSMVALAAGRRGIKAFSFIHDSFGVHPGRTEEFRDIIRDEFVSLYSGDTLATFRDQMQAQFPDSELPPVPYEEYGTLDINECKKSSYMFN